MIRLVLFELKKIFLKPVFVFVVIMLLCINFFSIYNTYKESTYLDIALLNSDKTFGDVYYDMYSDYSGEMTLEKIENLLLVYKPIQSKVADLTASSAGNVPNTLTGNVWSDYYLLNWLYVTPMEYMWTYQSVANDIVVSAYENIEFYSSYDNDYKVLENQKIIEIFRGRNIKNFEYTEMVNEYLHYDFSALLIIILLILAITNIFIYEQESKTDTIILASVKGGTSTLFAKIIALMIFITSITILFSIFDLLSFITIYGTTEGLLLPIYAIRDYKVSFFSGNILEYAMLSLILKNIGILSLVSIFLFVALSLRNSLSVFITNFSVSVFMIGVGLYFETLTGGIIKTINPYFLIFNKSLFLNCEFIKMFGTPILIVVAGVISSMIIGAVFMGLTIYAYPKNYHLRNGKGG